MGRMYEFEDVSVDGLLARPDCDQGLAITVALERVGVAEPWLAEYLRQVTLKNQFAFVYIIEGTHCGVTRHKIGKTNSLRDRVHTFNVKLPFDIKVVASFYVRNALEFEAQLHKMMRAKRIAGEWFDLGAADLHQLCLIGLARETGDIGTALTDDLDAMKEGPQMRDAEYIDYLESILVIRNIPFSRKVMNHGQKVIPDGEAVG